MFRSAGLPERRLSSFVSDQRGLSSSNSVQAWPRALPKGTQRGKGIHTDTPAISTTDKPIVTMMTAPSQIGLTDQLALRQLFERHVQICVAGYCSVRALKDPQEKVDLLCRQGAADLR